MRIVFEADTLPDRVRRTRLAVPSRRLPERSRMPRWRRGSGSWPVSRCRSSSEDRTWGMFLVTSDAGALPPEAETRLARFAQLVTASFDSIEARTRLRAVAEHDEAMRSIQQDAAGAPITRRRQTSRRVRGDAGGDRAGHPDPDRTAWCSRRRTRSSRSRTRPSGPREIHHLPCDGAAGAPSVSFTVETTLAGATRIRPLSI